MFKFILLFAALIVPFFIGHLFLQILTASQKRFQRWEHLCIAWGLGHGVLTLSMFFMSIVKISFNPISCTLCSLLPVCAAFVLLKTYKVFFPAPNRKNESWNFLGAILIVIMFFSGGLLLFRTWIIVDDGWDSWAFWAFKAKIYFSHQLIPFDQFSAFSRVWGNWDYPHHVPLMEAWIALWLGVWDDQCIRIIFPLFQIGLAVCLYYFFRCYVNRLISLSGALFVLTLPMLTQVTVGTWSEPIIIFYYILSFRFLLEWQEQKLKDGGFQNSGDSIFFLSALFAGLAAWTKHEGVVYVVLNLIVIGWMTKKVGWISRCTYVFSYIGIISLIILPWIILKSYLGIENVYENKISLTRIFQNLPGLTISGKTLLSLLGLYG